MPVKANPVGRVCAAASVAAIYRALPRRAQSSGQRESTIVSFPDGGKKERGRSSVSRATGWPAEVLRGRQHRVAGTAGHGVAISTHIKDAWSLPPGKDLPSLICHESA